MSPPLNIIMLGATGAVGTQVALTLSKIPSINKLTLLGRRPVSNLAGSHITQHIIDIFSPNSYTTYIPGHTKAICTLGVGQPSKTSKEEFIKVDKLAVLNFARACKEAGVEHFELLSAVGVSSSSYSFYLRTKGELEDGLNELRFKRLSLFHPSMIITPKNRYGMTQAIFLAMMPLLDPLLRGSSSKFRSITVERLGRAMALNLFETNNNIGSEILTWQNFMELSQKSNEHQS